MVTLVLALLLAPAVRLETVLVASTVSLLVMVLSVESSNCTEKLLVTFVVPWFFTVLLMAKLWPKFTWVAVVVTAVMTKSLPVGTSLTVTLVVALAVPPLLSVTVKPKVKTVSALTWGAVKVAVAQLALLIIAAGRAVWVQVKL